MALESAYRELLRQLEELHEALGALEFALDDKPLSDGLILADQLDDAAVEMRGILDEAIANLSKCVAQMEPSLLDPGKQTLISMQTCLNKLVQDYLEELADADRLFLLRRAGHERGGEWNTWAKAARAAIARCRPPLLASNRALLECWQELVEHLCRASGTIQTTTIHQPIIVPERTTVLTKGAKNS
jgi:hypothetical protein